MFFPSASEAVIYVMMGLVLLVRPHGLLGEEGRFDEAPLRQTAADALVWLLLLTMPYWLDAVGGYTQLGSRVLIMALAAMSLNFCSAIPAYCRSATPPISDSAPTAWD